MSIKLRHINRTHLKTVFWPNIFVGASLQILDIQQYASGLKLGPAAILNKNSIFETGSNNSLIRIVWRRYREMHKMKRQKKLTSLLLAALVFLSALVLIGNERSSAENPNESTAVFFVS